MASEKKLFASVRQVSGDRHQNRRHENISLRAFLARNFSGTMTAELMKVGKVNVGAVRFLRLMRNVDINVELNPVQQPGRVPRSKRHDVSSNWNILQ
jgi:hypothetical protein